jgi:hypothetical protein
MVALLPQVQKNRRNAQKNAKSNPKQMDYILTRLDRYIFKEHI